PQSGAVLSQPGVLPAQPPTVVAPQPTTPGQAGQPGQPGSVPPAQPGTPTPTPQATASPAPPPGPTARITVTTPGPTFQVGGGPYTVPISVVGAQRLSTISLTITYDPAILRVRSVQEGTFLQQGGVTPTFTHHIDPVAGDRKS